MLLDEIGAWLVERGVAGGATGWALAKAYMPPSPDQVVGLFETGGFLPSPSADRLTFQVRVRGAKLDYPGARSKIGQALDALQKLAGELSGAGYVSITAMQAPFPMGYDANDRPEVACNFAAVRLK